VVCEGDDRDSALERLDAAAAAVELDAEPLERKDVTARLEMPVGLLDADT
jgi:hypothetical protein